MCFLKKCLSFILSGAVTLPLLVPGNMSDNKAETIHAASTDVTYGDVNSDGKIDILDMIVLKSYINEKNTKDFSVKAADLDDDGEVSAKDAVELSMYLLNQTGSFSYEMNIDTDGDGLCDYIEKEMLGTDYQKKDTDGDGLDDYSEVYLCDTDPLNADTGKTDVKDSLKDTDGDKLTNAEEVRLGTSPTLTDTDEDGINDYDEVNKYRTHPLKEDTDGDSISDNGEIKLGLDSLKIKSDGKTSDAERTFEQKLNSDSETLKVINSEENPYKMSLSVKAAGYIDECVNVDISAYSNYLQNDAVVGDIIDINYVDAFKVEALTINFTVPENAENYYIFRYFEDVNMLLPVETKYDGNRVYAESTEDGTYCIVDMDKWIDNTADTSEIQSANAVYNAVYASSDTKSAESLEVYFLIYVKSVLADGVRNSIANASRVIIDYCNNTGKDIKIYFASYTGSTVISKETGNSYVSNGSSDDEIKEMLSRSGSAAGSLDTTNFNYSLTRTLKNSLLEIAGADENSKKYCFVVDVNFQPSSAANVAVIDEMKEYGVDFSFICNDNNNNIGNYESLSSDGSHYRWIPDFSEIVINKVLGNSTIISYNVNTGLCNNIPYNKNLITAEWKNIYKEYSSGKLSVDEIKKLGLPDTDGDGVCDCIELNMDLISFDDSGNLVLPTYKQVAESVLNNNIAGLKGLNQLAKALSEKGVNISDIIILPILSNPTLTDSDFDGIDDKIDNHATCLNIIEVKDKILDDTHALTGLQPSYKEENYNRVSIKENNKCVGTKYIFEYNIKSNIEFIESYYIVPDENSDYTIGVDSNPSSDFFYIVTMYEINRSGYRKPTSVIRYSDNAVDGKLGYSLKKDHKYEFLVKICPSCYDIQSFKTTIQQDNLVYIPQGCLATGKHTDDLYLCDESLKIIADRQGDSVLHQKDWENNKTMSDFPGALADNITDTIYSGYMRYSLNLLDSDNILFKLSGEISTAATYGGVLTLPVKVLSPVGNVLTVVGAGTTYLASYAIEKDDFRNELKESFIYLEKNNDKSIVISHEIYFGESVITKPWTNKFVNKYDADGKKLTINSFSYGS